jgi:hypothetical protein
MGEAKRRNKQTERTKWPASETIRDVIDLHDLRAVSEINGARIRALTGIDEIPETAQIILRAFRAEVGERAFNVGFCIGDGERFSAIGIAVIDRLMMAEPGTTLHVAPIVHQEIAWDIVLRHLRSFVGRTLLFAFRDFDTFDAGTAEIAFSDQVRHFHEGRPSKRLTSEDRRKIRAKKAEILERPPPPTFHLASGVEQEDAPWIFRFVTPTGKIIRTAIWNGRRDYAHEFSEDIIRWVGGDRIAIVQVDKPVGIDRRSSIALTNHFAKDFDAVIHWARDTETFQSIVKSFVRLDFESVVPPDLDEDWKPTMPLFGANGDDTPNSAGT